MDSIERKTTLNAVICILGVQFPTFATHFFDPPLAYASGTFVFHVAVLAGIMAVVWPLYGQYRDGTIEGTTG